MAIDAHNSAAGSWRRTLTIPPDYSNYAEEKGIFRLLERMLQEVLVHRPEDPLQFLQEFLSRPDQDVPKIVVYGPPASGQHSVSKIVSRKFRAVHIQPKDLLEAAGVKTVEEIPPVVLADLIHTRLQKTNCLNKGWIIQGCPRTREQVLALQAKGILLNHFIHLEAPDEALLERYQGKRIDPITSDVYHMVFNQPSDPDILARLQEEEGGSSVNMHQRLRQYHSNSQSVLSCYTKISKAFNADQPLKDLVTQVSSFLLTRQRSASPHTPRVILLGPPGAGKTMQATKLAEKYRLVNVDCNTIIQQTIVSGGRLADQMKPFCNKGLMVPDDIILTVIRKRLEQLDCGTRGWVLHGFPITREQAELLTAASHIANRVVFLELSEERAKERLCLRRLDPVTGEQYHLLYNPPPTQEIKDRLETNPADSVEAVEKHVQEYNLYADDLADYYTIAQHINADQDPYTVHECVESIIVNSLPKQSLLIE